MTRSLRSRSQVMMSLLRVHLKNDPLVWVPLITSLEFSGILNLIPLGAYSLLCWARTIWFCLDSSRLIPAKPTGCSWGEIGLKGPLLGSAVWLWSDLNWYAQRFYAGKLPPPLLAGWTPGLPGNRYEIGTKEICERIIITEFILNISCWEDISEGHLL